MADETKVTPPKEGPASQPRVTGTPVAPAPVVANVPTGAQAPAADPSLQTTKRATEIVNAQPGAVKQQTATGEVQADEKAISAVKTAQQQEAAAALAASRAAATPPTNTQGATAGPHTEKITPTPVVDRGMKEDNPPQTSAGPARRNTPGSPVGAENASPADTPAGMPVGQPAVGATGERARRIKELDKQIKDAQDNTDRQRRDDISLLMAQKRELEEQEARTVYGAPVLAPKTRLLDASFAEMQNPDYHYRWLNITDPSRVGARMATGYERVPGDEGGMQLGNEMALFRIPKDYYFGRTGHLRREVASQFKAPEKDYDKAVEEMVRILRDKYNVHISDKELQNVEGL